MNISLNWLREFVDWSGTTAQLDDLLTSTGMKVEGIATKGAEIPQVVIAQILESSQHPNADRLSVCRVDDGSGQPRQIVCGAKNYKVGDKVPLALPGAVLPGDFKIKVGKLRGVESEGMLCSAKEIGLGGDAAGLLILPADAPVGKPLSELYPPETILDLEITPNRADWLSHLGVAREIAAFTHAPLKWTRPQDPVTKTEDVLIRVEQDELCPFYSLRRIRGVKVGPSPQWLKLRLESVGLRSINNVVDITNLVMFELGQPLHAFDAAKVNGSIVVRLARDGEKFLALDGREYTLTADQLVIADEVTPLALAGLMGGENSGVTESTTEILLESALFQTTSIRRTGRVLDLHSDSSYRFERGVDPASVFSASFRAAELIVELTGGYPDEEVSVVGKLPPLPAPIRLSNDRCRALLGTAVSDEEIRTALEGLGLAWRDEAWTIPTFRLDLTREVDLIEEVARVVGIDRITGRLGATATEPSAADNAYDFQMDVRRRLLALGLSEGRTSTLVSEAMLDVADDAVRLKNPLGEDQAFLRKGIAAGLLVAVGRNARYGAKTIGLYEIGRTFRFTGKTETTTLAIALSGEAAATTWRGGKNRPLDWHDAKGVLESLLPSDIAWQKAEALPPLALKADILFHGRKLGWLGQVSPSIVRDLDATSSILLAELDLDTLQTVQAAREFQEIPKFPAMTRDLAVVVPIAISYGEIADVLHAAKEELMADVAPFDVFTDPSGAKLPADRKSLAISLTFRASGRTLNSEEVNAACERLRQLLRAKLAVDFRE